MPTKLKTLRAAFVLSFFLLIGWATSYEDDYFDMYFEAQITNTSDSCDILDLRYIYRVRRDNFDTVDVAPGYNVVPSEIYYDFRERINVRQLLYTCACPNDTLSQKVDVALDSTYILKIELDCD